MGSYDFARRRRGVRKGRERGCWVYIPQEELQAAERESAKDGGAPFYRVWGSRRGVVLRLYKEG